MPQKPTVFRPYERPRRLFAAQATKAEAKRPSSRARGYDEKWRRLRIKYLKTHRWCKRCAFRGVATPAREVDHVVPFRGPEDPLRLDWKNLQALCRSCHAAKTHADKRRERSEAGP